jgi:small ubiquitin-related modifier
LTGCSTLQALPPWLSALTALEVLDLEDCPAALPEEQLESGIESLPNANVHLNLKFKGQDGCFDHFKITKTTALKKFMEEYCALQRLEMSTTCFLFKGERVCETQTPAEMNMQDDDVIDARDDETCWMCKGSTLKRLQELTAQVTSLHSQMQVLENQRSRQDAEQMRLKRLRQQRVLRPRILFSYAVSSKDGRGLEQLRRALSVLMQNQVLFPHVGMKVPLNYAMLERLAQEGRGRVDAEANPERAVWESAVTKHVEAKASDALRRLCARPHVTLAELKAEAGKVGMDKGELESALAYLHATGSALYYGKENRFEDCLENRFKDCLKETVFLQPQFIINAIKYVIREHKAEDVNDELREMDKRIRNQKDLKDLFTRGVLTGYLLNELWTFDKCSFTPQDRKLLLEVMKGFKLLRLLGPPGPPGNAIRERYVVPAMLPNHELPDTYVTPEWWRPEKADGAAGFADAQSQASGLGASMRVMYEVVGGRLPFSFMSKLQVSLALKPSKDAKHYAPEAAIVDRVSGSVMSDTYTCGGGNVTEWVVISQCTKSCHVGAVDGTPQGPEWDSIRVVAWAELINGSQLGATDWRLFKRVMHEVEGAERESPGLYLRKLALYVGADGQCAEPECVEDEEFCDSDFCTFTFRFEQTSERIEKVERNRVLPQENVETRLVNRQPVTVPQSTLHQIDAFFAKETGDLDLDLNREGQLLTRIVVDPGCGWNCTVHPQPTIDDLYKSIELAKLRNMRVLHLSGHASQECGFIWNGNDAATSSKTFDVESISLAIGAVAGECGPLECVVLNACCTEKMGRSLRQRGVPNVVCWQTPVWDETARELCGRFFRPLVEEKQAGNLKRDYKRAFIAATDAMRVSEDGVSTAEQEEHSGSNRRASFFAAKDAMRSSARPEDGVSTAEQEPSGSGPSSRRGSERRSSTGSQRALVSLCPWLYQDVVLFLSNDGDSQPTYLWRERPVESAPPLPPPADAGQTLAPNEHCVLPDF